MYSIRAVVRHSINDLSAASSTVATERLGSSRSILSNRAAASTAQHSLASVDFSLNAASSVPTSLLGQGDVDIAVASGSLSVGFGSSVAALDVAGDEEATEEVGQGSKVQDVEPDGKGLGRGGDAGLDGVNGVAASRCGSGRSRAEDDVLDGADGGRDNKISRRCGRGNDGSSSLGGGDRNQVGDERVNHGVGGTEDELGDLHRGQSTLQSHGNLDRERSNGVVGVHESVDEGVDQDKDPDGNGHVANASPHAKHGTSVVVGLESRAVLALSEDDEGVQDFVELAEVEDPAVVGETFVPETAHLVRVGVTSSIEKRRGSISSSGHPLAAGLVEEHRVAQSRSTVDTTQAINSGSDAARAGRAADTALHSTKHTPESPSGVNGEEDVVEDNESLEGSGLADGPWLLVARAVVAVEQLDGDGVCGGNGQRNLGIKSCSEPAGGDIERVHDGQGGISRRNWSWLSERWQIEQVGGWPGGQDV